MKMETFSFPGMLVTIYKIVRHHNPRDNSHNSNNLKPHKRICRSVNQLELTIERGSCTITLIALYVTHLVSLLDIEFVIFMVRHIAVN